MQGMTWVSPLNYGAALATGNGLNARKGEEEVASWSPAWQAVGRVGELYVGPKMTKAAPKIIKRVSKVANKTINNYKLARTINKAVNENPVITGYNRNPAFKDIGTLSDYQNYLQQVFPNTKVKDVLWHGSKIKGLEKFSTDFIGSNMPIKKSTGMYLSPYRKVGENYGTAKGRVYPVLLNTENPYFTTQFLDLPKNGVNITKISPKTRNTLLSKNDAVIAPRRGEIAFFDPDNALILGSNIVM
jgi:hypothetical protein